MEKIQCDFSDYVEAKSVRIPWSGCHIWIGSATAGGYGTSVVAERIYGTTIVHRALFQHLNGTAPRGAYICHECDTPSCVNPDHLFLGTPTDNAQDRKMKCRSATKIGHYNGRAKIKFCDLPEIRRLIADGKDQKDIAAMFDVSQSAISRIKRGVSWGDV